jgi:hypothetical protein
VIVRIVGVLLWGLLLCRGVDNQTVAAVVVVDEVAAGMMRLVFELTQ